MSNIRLVKLDILKFFQSYTIIQQCDCVTTNCHYIGFSHTLKKKFEINPYDHGPRRIPGTIQVFQKEYMKRPSVICFFSQVYPGLSKFPIDSPNEREYWFQKCLDQISGGSRKGTTVQTDKVAFPYKIGCGHAGGHWENYLEMINNFAKRNPDVQVLVCQK